MKISRETLPLYAMKALHWAAWGVCALALAAASMLILTPCLLPFLTLGACLWGQERQEFFEYALASFHMALFPMLLAAASALVGYGFRFGVSRVETKAKRAEAEKMDLNRMKNLTAQQRSQGLAAR